MMLDLEAGVVSNLTRKCRETQRQQQRLSAPE
jgi:hypothetical protein